MIDTVINNEYIVTAVSQERVILIANLNIHTGRIPDIYNICDSIFG